MRRLHCTLLAALAGAVALPGASAAAAPAGYPGYRCVQYGSRFNIESSRSRFGRHGAAWRHDEFALSGFYGGPGIRRNYSLGWGWRGPACSYVGGEFAAFAADAAPRAGCAPPPPPTPAERRAASEGSRRAADPWGLLEEGRFSEARRLFAVAAIRDTSDAAAMAGFALASAFRGEFDAATTAMRTAIETDAAALRGLDKVNDLLAERMRSAAEAASRRAERDPSGGDSAFLAAGMYWILNDDAAALAAVLAAAFRGDDEPSTRILYRELSTPPPEAPPEAEAPAAPAPGQPPSP